MPIWLRRFTLKELIDIRNAQNEANEKAIKKSKKGQSIDFANPDKSKIPKQAFSPPTTKSRKPPTYSTRASKKMMPFNIYNKIGYVLKREIRKSKKS